MIEILIPYPPSANGLREPSTKIVKRDGIRRRVSIMRKSEFYKRWQTDTFWTIREQTNHRFKGKYVLSVFLVKPDRRTRDLDNTIKAVSDILKLAKIIRDDSDCEHMHLYWVPEGSPCRVRIEDYDPAIHRIPD